MPIYLNHCWATVLFGLSLIVWGSESLPKFWTKFCFLMGRQRKWISSSKFPFPPCELSYISIVSPKWQEKHKSSLLHVSHWLSTEIRFGKYKNKISLYSAPGTQRMREGYCWIIELNEIVFSQELLLAEDYHFFGTNMILSWKKNKWDGQIKSSESLVVT